jgi:monovalent cation:H+ antiporter-2, CPA2 family
LTLVIGLFLLVLFLIGMIGIKFVKIPDILLYILLGLVLSFVMKESKVIEVAGEIGLVLLFFLLGMKFPIGRFLLNSARVWKGGVLDAVLGILVSAVISFLFGLDLISSLIVGGIVYATSSLRVFRYHSCTGKWGIKGICQHLYFSDCFYRYHSVPAVPKVE